MPDGRQFSAEQSLTSLVAGAIDGHSDAWTALVARLERVVWKSVNMMTFDHEARDDAFAATWLRLAERLDTIREPEKLPGWLATTACNEVRQILRQRSRQQTVRGGEWTSTPVGVSELLDTLAGDDGDHSRGLVLDESRRNVRAAFGRLDPQCREIIAVLVLSDPPVPYEEASDRLNRPIGSLGPSRRRCLQKMKSLLEGDPTDPPIDHRGAS